MTFVGRISFVYFPCFIVLASAMTGFRRDYCKLDCTIDGKTYKHILCELKHQTSAGKCSDIKGKMSPEERMHILVAHNLRRDRYLYGFKADCFRQFRWSYVLEEAAQIYAEQCKETVPYHCARDYVEEYQVWMNIYEVQNPSKDPVDLLTAAFKFWMSTESSGTVDVSNWKFDYSSPYNPWASIFNWQTFELGCGRSEYTKDGGKWGTLVCLYGPGINDWDPDKPALYVHGIWLTGTTCSTALCQNRYADGISFGAGPVDPWLFLCAAPQDEFAWGYQHIPDRSGPDDLEFITPKSNSTSSSEGHPPFSIFLVLSPVLGILNW